MSGCASADATTMPTPMCGGRIKLPGSLRSVLETVVMSRHWVVKDSGVHRLGGGAKTQSEVPEFLCSVSNWLACCAFSCDCPKDR